MANQLKMADRQAIIALARLGWSFRRIADELGVHRETVARYVKLSRTAPEPDVPPPERDAAAAMSAGGPCAAGSFTATELCESKPSISITGSTPAKPSISITGSAGRPSQCEPFRAIIIDALDRGLSARRIWQDLRTDHGFADGYQSVQRFVRRLRSATPLPFRRMECEPGAEAQIDFGKGAPIITPDARGKRRRTHVFRIILSHSRKGYSESVFRQTTEEFIRCIENAFQYFGGVPRTLVIDNLKAAVLRADWFDPELNPKIQAFCEHYGTVILPTRPRTPRHKGKVERGVDYVQDNALKGRVFAGLQDQNRHLMEWETRVADTRIHGTTRRQVGKVFADVERAALQPLPVTRFPFFHEAERRVHRDGHIAVDKAYYSVPPEYVGHTVWVRWDSRMVRIHDRHMRQIAIHVRHEPGRFSTQSPHVASEKISGVERGAAWLLNKVGWIGPHAQQWAESMLQARGIQGVRVLQGLISLANRHPGRDVEQACRIARTHEAYRLRTLRALIKRQAGEQEQLEFIREHPIIRSLTDYEDLVHGSFATKPLCSSEPRHAVPGDTGSAGFPEPLPWTSFPSNTLTGEPHHE